MTMTDTQQARLEAEAVRAEAILKRYPALDHVDCAPIDGHPVTIHRGTYRGDGYSDMTIFHRVSS